MRECRRVAKSGGVLALTTNLRDHMQEFYEVFNRVLDELGDVTYSVSILIIARPWRPFGSCWRTRGSR
jgi:hypothetical protein